MISSNLPASGWPFPGSFVWCRAASGGTQPIRLHLHAATKHNDGGVSCEDCRVRGHCGRLQAELVGQRDLFAA